MDYICTTEDWIEITVGDIKLLNTRKHSSKIQVAGSWKRKVKNKK